ncbi:MAG: zinc ribbon domain-containing protein [Coriobacteriia bacterium]|nr:zinc ribbon domain-containing protein [Coriobacteriia bacterium]
MARMRARSLLLTVVGVLVAVGALFGVLLMVNAESGFTGCTGTTRFGWMAPLLAVSIIGGLAWILLSQEPRSEERDVPEVVVCPSCGRDVRGQWRLCPYCGRMLRPESTSGSEVPKSD